METVGSGRAQRVTFTDKMTCGELVSAPAGKAGAERTQSPNRRDYAANGEFDVTRQD